MLTHLTNLRQWFIGLRSIELCVTLLIISLSVYLRSLLLADDSTVPNNVLFTLIMACLSLVYSGFFVLHFYLNGSLKSPYIFFVIEILIAVSEVIMASQMVIPFASYICTRNNIDGTDIRSCTWVTVSTAIPKLPVRICLGLVIISW